MELYFIPFTPFGPPSRPRPVLQSCAVKRGERRKLFSAFPALPPPVYPRSEEGKVEGPEKRRSCFRSRQKRGPSPCFDPTFNYFPPSPPPSLSPSRLFPPLHLQLSRAQRVVVVPVLGEREKRNFAQGRKRGNLLWMGEEEEEEEEEAHFWVMLTSSGMAEGESFRYIGAGVHGPPGESRPPPFLLL